MPAEVGTPGVSERLKPGEFCRQVRTTARLTWPRIIIRSAMAGRAGVFGPVRWIVSENSPPKMQKLTKSSSLLNIFHTRKYKQFCSEICKITKIQCDRS